MFSLTHSTPMKKYRNGKKILLDKFFFCFMHKLIKKEVATKLNIYLQNNIRSIFFHEENDYAEINF